MSASLRRRRVCWAISGMEESRGGGGGGREEGGRVGGAHVDETMFVCFRWGGGCGEERSGRGHRFVVRHFQVCDVSGGSYISFAATNHCASSCREW